jgi:PadR family transcriptional regulator AphA
VKPAKVNDALLVKLYGGHLTNTENLLNELERHQTTHITTLNKLLKIEHTYLQLPSDKQSKYLLPYLTLRRGILGEKAWLTWAKEARKMIKI